MYICPQVLCMYISMYMYIHVCISCVYISAAELTRGDLNNYRISTVGRCIAFASLSRKTDRGHTTVRLLPPVDDRLRRLRYPGSLPRLIRGCRQSSITIIPVVMATESLCPASGDRLKIKRCDRGPGSGGREMEEAGWLGRNGS